MPDGCSPSHHIHSIRIDTQLLDAVQGNDGKSIFILLCLLFLNDTGILAMTD
jgi:hypothetical protein